MAAASIQTSGPWLLLLQLLLFQSLPCDAGDSRHNDTSGDSRESMYNHFLQVQDHSHDPAHPDRHTPDCQPVIHGTGSYESWPGSNHSNVPVADSLLFVTDIPEESKYVYGRLTRVHDPLRTVSVLEPGGPGGCGMNLMVSVEETAQAAGCLYAQNAGFFHVDTRQCLGNIISNGQMVQESNGVQNAQFGIRKDGTLVFGYLSEEDVMDQSNPFVQLVTGVVWLLRNREVYINQSLEAECDKTQETGSLSTFVNVLSARTAVGHDAEGKLVLFHCEGQTGVRGMSLWEVAEFLKNYGVINAINLDGGGSSTFVINGTLASYPTDHCASDGRWRCGRRVSTILCVHPRRCQPPDCSGHGDCVDGRCQCQRGWEGVACDALTCQPSECGAHGVCTADGCLCDAGWQGQNCSQECLPGFYGDNCKQRCTCANGASCDNVHGRCFCPPGFHGDFCEKVCPLGFFGISCSQKCVCDYQCLCDAQTGSCNNTQQPDYNHTAVQCLVNQMKKSWRRQDEEGHRGQTEPPYLSDLLLHFLKQPACPGLAAVHLAKRQDYSYIPLGDISEAASRAEAHMNESRTLGEEMEDSDPEEEIRL
ncbi:N-acetylglucosamine-1-phosphodiester alpha-N-acetylglucosaminidase isoform X2 [Cynoglossus semilaevis]|uniref:N-acetylglucosamine-1-phosphodiester alpha-N-acetylglucosaminidase isoform X2 n=1 Tax=Cynoglossus semilaevis TaxID=244447 RepID=UPI0004962D7D|nr:N-acetylglucosamine-1-phosphodiester alpha-N-acetylglucosaminidase isoform X2 [Cynoglossus semilaevis]